MKDQEFENILRQAMQPSVDLKEIVVPVRVSGKETHMTMKRMMKKGCIAAALIALLSTSVYASGALNIKTLVSGMHSRAYNTVAQAEEKAGFEMDDLSRFTNGYAFDGVRVEEVRGLDEKDKVQIVYNEICVKLKNAAGEQLHLSAYQERDGLQASDVPADQIRKLGEVTLEYRLHHYKFVPADYEQTEEDKLWLQQPGNYMSYGSEKGISESSVAFLNWQKEGICYLLMDSDGSESAESLFSMAQELVLNGK